MNQNHYKIVAIQGSYREHGVVSLPVLSVQSGNILKRPGSAVLELSYAIIQASIKRSLKVN